MSNDGFISGKALERLTETLGGDPADLLDIIESFLDEAPSILQDMELSAGAKNLDTLRRAAHSLKSNARDLGAERLAGMCQKMETQLSGNAPDGDHVADVAAIVSEWQGVRGALVEEMKRIRQNT